MMDPAPGLRPGQLGSDPHLEHDAGKVNPRDAMLGILLSVLVGQQLAIAALR